MSELLAKAIAKKAYRAFSVGTKVELESALWSLSRCASHFPALANYVKSVTLNCVAIKSD